LKFLQISDVETLINASVVITAVLGRIFLKEKITVAHLVSLLATIVGVVFTLKSDFLFSSPLGYGTGYNASNTPESSKYGDFMYSLGC
jgi:drug/metabolite transporter (DMT)-like permease